MAQMVTCSSCQELNDYDKTQVCVLCGAPLLMTKFASVAPVAQAAAASSAPAAGGGLNPIGGSSGLNSVSMLVPVNFNGAEDFQRALKLLPNEFTQTIGWPDFQAGHFPNLDFRKMYSDLLLVNTPNGEQMAISRKTGTIRRDRNDDVFLSCDLEASSLMWVQKPQENPIQVLPGNEVVLEPGMYIYLGKNNHGMTFVVR